MSERMSNISKRVRLSMLIEKKLFSKKNELVTLCEIRNWFNKNDVIVDKKRTLIL